MLATSTDVEVAWISGVAVIAAASITSLMAWMTSRRNKSTLGRRNGNGTVIEMLERMLLKQDRHNELDTKRFKRLYTHLDIPFDQEEEEAV